MSGAPTSTVAARHTIDSATDELITSGTVYIGQLFVFTRKRNGPSLGQLSKLVSLTDTQLSFSKKIKRGGIRVAASQHALYCDCGRN